ncbi:hypothetical protein D3C72_1144080 [compost metagenome]
MALILLHQEIQARLDLIGSAIVGQQLLGHQAREFGRIGHDRFQVKPFALRVLLQQRQAGAQHGGAHHGALAYRGIGGRQGVVGGIQRLVCGIHVRGLGRQRGLRLFAVVVDDLRHRLVDQALQGLDRFDRARPVVLGFKDADQRTQRRQRVARVLQLLETAFGAVQHASFKKVLRQFVLGVLAFGIGQVGTAEQALVHADGALHFTAPAEQATQREVQLCGFRVQLGDFDKGIDRAVRLFIEQEIQPPEIGVGQAAGFPKHLPDIEARGQPAQREQHRHENQPPRFKIHGSGSCGNSVR